MIKNLKPSIAEAGKIKIGGLGEERQSKRGGTYRMPQKFDHFVITTTKRDDAGNLTHDPVMAAIEPDPDGKIRKIPIVLHSDDIDQVFRTEYAMYSGKKLACKGDGETATRFRIVDGKRTGEQKQLDCTCELLGADKEPRCKPNGVLACTIAVKGHAVAGAVYTWRTTSIISINRMVGSLMQIQNVVGTLRGIPLSLVVEPIQTNNGTVYCCHVELREIDVSQAQQRAIEASQMRSIVRGELPPAQIIAPQLDDEPEEEQAEIAEEFYPEEQETEATAAELMEKLAEAKADNELRKLVMGQAQ